MVCDYVPCAQVQFFSWNKRQNVPSKCPPLIPQPDCIIVPGITTEFPFNVGWQMCILHCTTAASSLIAKVGSWWPMSCVGTSAPFLWFPGSFCGFQSTYIICGMIWILDMNKTILKEKIFLSFDDVFIISRRLLF